MEVRKRNVKYDQLNGLFKLKVTRNFLLGEDRPGWLWHHVMETFRYILLKCSLFIYR